MNEEVTKLPVKSRKINKKKAKSARVDGGREAKVDAQIEEKVNPGRKKKKTPEGKVNVADYCREHDLNVKAIRRALRSLTAKPEGGWNVPESMIQEAIHAAQKEKK